MGPAGDFAKGFSEVHPLPHVAASVISLINDPEATMRAFEEVIQTDPVLVGRLLRLVNSAYYGLNQKVDSIGRAVAFLGMKNLHHLVVADAVKNIFDSRTQTAGFSKPALWAHCSAVSICAKMVAERIFSLNGDDAFLCGILHDFGLVVEEQVHPEKFTRICSLSGTTTSLTALEQEIFATDHCEIGYTITLEWNIAPNIQEAILHHHRISDDIEITSLTGILQLSEYITDQLQYPELEQVRSEISPHLYDHLQDNLDEYTLIVEDLPDEIDKAQAVHR